MFIEQLFHPRPCARSSSWICPLGLHALSSGSLAISELYKRKWRDGNLLNLTWLVSEGGLAKAVLLIVTFLLLFTSSCNSPSSAISGLCD